MWEEFSDLELAQIAGNYEMQDLLEFSSDFTLTNRAAVEKILTEYEFVEAFGE